MSPLSLHWLSRLAGCVCLYARSLFCSLSHCFLCFSRDSSLLNFATRQHCTRSYNVGFLIEAGRRIPSHTGDLLKTPHRRHSSHESAAALAASAAVSRRVEAASCTTLQIRVASPCLLERGLGAGRHVSRSSPGAGATLNYFSGTHCRPAPSPTAELDRIRAVPRPQVAARQLPTFGALLWYPAPSAAACAGACASSDMPLPCICMPPGGADIGPGAGGIENGLPIIPPITCDNARSKRQLRAACVPGGNDRGHTGGWLPVAGRVASPSAS
jgi:hypothetical protein